MTNIFIHFVIVLLSDGKIAKINDIVFVGNSLEHRRAPLGDPGPHFALIVSIANVFLSFSSCYHQQPRPMKIQPLLLLNFVILLAENKTPLREGGVMNWWTIKKIQLFLPVCYNIPSLSIILLMCCREPLCSQRSLNNYSHCTWNKLSQIMSVKPLCEWWNKMNAV